MAAILHTKKRDGLTFRQHDDTGSGEGVCLFMGGNF